MEQTLRIFESEMSLATAQLNMEGGDLKKLNLILPLIVIIGLVAGSANASVMEMAADSYTKPETWTTVASVSPIDLDHNKYMYWILDDQYTSPEYLHQVDIVFHNIYNSDLEDNYLNLYFADYDGDDAGWYTLHDSQSLTYPNWSEWTHLGTWSDTDSDATVNDVVFSITGEALAGLTNGNQYIIGIDPDCHFFGDEISVNVPEPAALFLLGSGILGLLFIRPNKYQDLNVT